MRLGAAAFEQALEGGSLAVPARLAGDRSELGLGNQAARFGWQKQDVFIQEYILIRLAETRCIPGCRVPAARE